MPSKLNLLNSFWISLMSRLVINIRYYVIMCFVCACVIQMHTYLYDYTCKLLYNIRFIIKVILIPALTALLFYGCPT